MLTTILATIVVLGILIFVHELGHFVTAKLVDIEVPRFSIGLGPKLWGFKHGETEYIISWLPLGGYVQMAGMEEMEMVEGKRERETEEPEATGIAGATDLGLTREEASATSAEGETRGEARARDFESKSLPARFLVISAGVIMNFLFAIVVFAASAMIWGVEVPPESRLPAIAADEMPEGGEALADVPAGTRVTAIDGQQVEDWSDVRLALLTATPGPVTLSFEDAGPVTVELPANDSARAEFVVAIDPGYEPVIGQVVGGSVAERAGIEVGDRIVAAGGEPMRSWREVVTMIQAHPDQPLSLTVERAGETLDLEVTPEAQTIEAPDAEPQVVGRIGAGVDVPRDKMGLVGGLSYGVARTWEVVSVIVTFLGDLFTGNASPRSLGGPIMIGQLSGEVARAGAETFLSFMALISVNLAVLNLLPIPVLDGGHLMFLLFEAVRGRPLSQEQRLRFTQFGFLIVVAIMVWAIANDVLRLFGI